MTTVDSGPNEEQALFVAPVSPERQIGRSELVRQMFREALEVDTQIPVRGGSALAGLQEVEDRTEANLKKFSPPLPKDALYGKSYQSAAASERFKEPGIREYILALAGDHTNRLEAQAKKLVESGGSPTIRFADSPYVPMGSIKRSCEVAAFLMPFGAITGDLMYTEEMTRIIKNEGIEEVEDVEGSTLLKMFDTPAFHKKFPDIDCRAIAFAGCTVDDLANMHEKITNRYPESEVRAVLSIRSNQKEKGGANLSIIHQVVPLLITPDQIIAHDPAKYGSEDGVFDTADLLRRWYMAHGSGYLLVTQRTDS